MASQLEVAGGRVEWINGDVCDTGLWQDLSLRGDIDYLVHGAAVTSINRYLELGCRRHIRGAVPSISVNIDGTVNALGSAQSMDGLRRMIYVSSGSVYGEQGPQGRALREDECVAPDGIYAITKYTGELFADFCRRECALPVVSVRLSGVYGELDRITPSREVRCVPKIIAEHTRDRRPIRVRALDAVGDFIHADDVADAIIALLHVRDTRHGVYNVAYGATCTISALLDLAREKQSDLLHMEMTHGDVEINYPVNLQTGRWGAYDIERLRGDTGWQPRPLRTAFHAYLNAVLADER